MSDETKQTPDDTPKETLDELIARKVAEGIAAAATGNESGDDGPAMPKVPKLDHAPETPEEVSAFAKIIADFRAEVFALRGELRQRAGQQVQIAGPTETVEERTNKRLEAIAAASHYCPGCGELGQYPQRCTGPKGGHPHPPIEMVSTEELGGDPNNHTAAPATDPTGYPALAA